MVNIIGLCGLRRLTESTLCADVWKHPPPPFYRAWFSFIWRQVFVLFIIYTNWALGL